MTEFVEGTPEYNYYNGIEEPDEAVDGDAADRVKRTAQQQITTGLPALYAGYELVQQIPIPDAYKPLIIFAINIIVALGTAYVHAKINPPKTQDI